MAKKKSNKGIIIIVISIVLIIAIVAVILSNRREHGIEITTSKVQKRTITQSVSAIGKIQPETEVKISSQTSGELIFLGVKEGDLVKQNQMLVKINPDIIETQLEQYKAAADAAKIDIEAGKIEMERSEADLKRISDLYKKEFSSKQEFEKMKAVFDQASNRYQQSLVRFQQSMASYKQVQRNAERTTIYSPINGVITLLNVEKGEKVVGTEMMQGTEMMRVSDLSVMNVMVDVDENDIVLVQIGDTAKIEIDAFPKREFKGVVIEIGHSAKLTQLGTQDQVTNFEVKIRILETETKLRPGMSSNVEILTETRHNVLSIPLMAATVRDLNKDEKEKMKKPNSENDDNEVKKANDYTSVVFTIKDKKAKMIKVETGISDNGFIEILSGLKDGQEIISGPFSAVSKDLKDSASVIKSSLKKSGMKWKKE